MQTIFRVVLLLSLQTISMASDVSAYQASKNLCRLSANTSVAVQIPRKSTVYIWNNFYHRKETIYVENITPTKIALTYDTVYGPVKRTLLNREEKHKQYFYTCQIDNITNDNNIEVCLFLNSSIWNSLSAELSIINQTQKLKGTTFMKLACMPDNNYLVVVVKDLESKHDDNAQCELNQKYLLIYVVLTIVVCVLLFVIYLTAKNCRQRKSHSLVESKEIDTRTVNKNEVSYDYVSADYRNSEPSRSHEEPLYYEIIE